MKNVIIVGGGIAGMSAGIYLQQAGFETEIFDKNVVAGGQCTGWDREGYHIDNCIHWLTGTKEGTAANRLWRNLGALSDDVDMIKQDKFFTVCLNGEKLTLWRDLEKTRREMLALSKEDEEEINRFIDNTKLSESMQVPVEKPFDMMSIADYMKLGKSMSDVAKVLKTYGKMDLQELSDRFHHPLLKKAIVAYMPPRYQAYALLVSYATITSGNGNVPLGGSRALALRVLKRYEELGGIFHRNSPVSKVVIENKKATAVILKDGSSHSADYIICACDTNYTFSQLLGKQYMSKQFKKAYERRDLYPVISGFQTAFAIDGKFEEMLGTHIFPCRPFTIAHSTPDYFSYTSYHKQPDFAPEGKSIIQCNFVQTEEDYQYWMELKKNPEEYAKMKQEKAEEIRIRLIEAMPFLQDKLHLLDVWTPATYNMFCNSYHGSYMSFIITKDAKDMRMSHKIKGLSNVFLASQWQMGPGGLPTAAAMGKFAAQHILKKEGLNYNV